MSKGKITIEGGGVIEIEDFVQAFFKDGRVASVCGLEDGSLALVVNNPSSSGRAAQAAIRLSKESTMALIFTCFLYFFGHGDSVDSLFKSSVENSEVLEFTYSDNLSFPK